MTATARGLLCAGAVLVAVVGIGLDQFLIFLAGAGGMAMALIGRFR